jgi:hypothetical protein
MPDTQPPGQLAYTVFWQTLAEAMGDAVPWEALHAATRRAWDAAAQAVLAMQTQEETP